MSIGCGLRINLPKDMTLRLSWGFPLMNNNHEEVDKRCRFHFELSISPDFDALVKLRRPKEHNIEKVKLDKPEIKLAETVQNNNKPLSRSFSQYLSMSNQEIAHKIISPKPTVKLQYTSRNKVLNN